MSDPPIWHEFSCGGKIWSVARHKSAQASQTGLYFRHGNVHRFLVFTRGSMPSDRDLQSMSVEVFRVFLERSGVT